MFFRRNSAEKGNRFSRICNSAGLSISIYNPIIEIPIFNICGRRNPYESCIFI